MGDVLSRQRRNHSRPKRSLSRPTQGLSKFYSCSYSIFLRFLFMRYMKAWPRGLAGVVQRHSEKQHIVSEFGIFVFMTKAFKPKDFNKVFL